MKILTCIIKSGIGLLASLQTKAIFSRRTAGPITKYDYSIVYIN